MIILGIETSCDETAAAVIKATTKDKLVQVLSNVSPSSMALHAKTGGIIPEIAAREQSKSIIPVIEEALTKAGLSFGKGVIPEIDAIAITYGPGLIGSLLVGVETAKTLSLAWNKPLIPVNHLFGHMYANWIQKDKEEKPITFPILALIISGGHTDLVLIKTHQTIAWLGGTRDDASGEALDKIGRLLHLPYPGGPAIEEKAKQGKDNAALHFPRPLMHDKSFDFSFSGLKTAVLREIQKHETIDEQLLADICKATQEAVIDVLLHKTMIAARQYNVNSIIIAGGVSANQTLRTEFAEKLEKDLPHISFFAPEKKYSTDNGAMIATAAFYNDILIPRENLTANPELYFD